MSHVEALAFDRSTPSAQASAASYIATRLEGYGYSVQTQPVDSSENLIAVLPGATHPDDIFVLGAHFDTVAGSPGADDDATGVATVLEVARVLAGVSLDRTLHLVFFALEETGYRGSEAYAASLAASGANVTAMISLDLVGYTCATPGCQILLPSVPGCIESTVTSDVGDFIGLGANRASEDFAARFTANAALYVPALAVQGFVVEGDGTCFSQSRRSDHKSFWDEGYPAVILGDGADSRNPNYHQATDLPDTLDGVFLTDVARAVMAQIATSRLAGSRPVPLLPPLARMVLAGLLAGCGARALGRRSPRPA